MNVKRPFSYSKLKSNLQDALQQLAYRYDAAPQPLEARGIVAISISKAENSGRKFLRVRREAELSPIIDQLIEKCVITFQAAWARVSDPRTIAILLHLKAPAMTEDIKLLTMARYFAFIRLAPDPNDANLVQLVSDKLFYEP